MKPSKIDPDDILRNAKRRAEDVAYHERELERLRGLRAADASWLVRNTDLSRSLIAAALGVSRQTLHQYLKDAGITDEYLYEVRKVQREHGVVLYSPDVSKYLDTGEQA